MTPFRAKLTTPRQSTWLPRTTVRKVSLSQRPGMLLINGIFCFSPNDWQIPLCNWGEANAPRWNWGWVHYDADAIFTGLWLNQHADQVATAITDQLSHGAPFVDVTCHSEGNEVLVRALLRNPLAKVRKFNSVAAAMYADCRTGWWRNGINDLITDGQIQEVRNFTSTNDGVLGSPLQWLPYWLCKTYGIAGGTNMDPASAYSPQPDNSMGHLDWMKIPLIQKIVGLEATP